MPALYAFLERRLWLFDFDNTLTALERQVDWKASRRALECFLRRQGVDEALLRQFPTRNLPLYDALLARQMAEPHRGTEISRQASAIIESYELRGVEKAVPLHGAPELMLLLNARRRQIAIVTSNSSRTVERWLQLHRLTHTVRTIVGRDSLLPLKPSPMMLARAIQMSCRVANETIMVGDSEADAQAARDAGVDFLGIASDPAMQARLQELGASAVFSSPGDLAYRLFGSETSPQRTCF